MSVDFISLGRIIFKDKDKYKFITDSDKESNFFIFNRKFAFRDIKKAQFFNNKNINKPSALDIWFNIFHNTTNIPKWYWLTKTKKNEKKKFKNSDLKDLEERYNLTDNDIEFLIIYYEDELKEKIKKIKKFKK